MQFAYKSTPPEEYSLRQYRGQILLYDWTVNGLLIRHERTIPTVQKQDRWNLESVHDVLGSYDCPFSEIMEWVIREDSLWLVIDILPPLLPGKYVGYIAKVSPTGAIPPRQMTNEQGEASQTNSYPITNQIATIDNILLQYFRRIF